jgi:AraC family transcriptional regulator
MNLYVDLINSTIEYIEEKIYDRLSLEEISRNFCISEFHFNRMFKTVTGKTLKQYILGRKLSLAFKKLSTTDKSVIDIAYDFGFEYPEVFSRAFKKQFGISPSGCRNFIINTKLVDKATVVDRDIVNYKGSLALKGSLRHMEKLNLQGICFETDVNSTGFESLMKSKWDEFLKLIDKNACFGFERTYSAVKCSGEDNGEYTVFYGFEGEVNCKGEFMMHTIPEGCYASFIYKGSMFDIRETFVDDLYRWIMVHEIELDSSSIGMLNIYEKDYLKTESVEILVSVKEHEHIARNIMKV